MAIFTITTGEQTDLSVVKITPISFDCFTLYEYAIYANQGDTIDITLTGDHYEEVYQSNFVESSFTDSATGITFNTSLRVRFILLNSGTTGVYSSSTIRVDNVTTGFYYENSSTRQNDSANCYNPTDIPSNTSDLVNDGEDGVNPFLDATDLGNYVTLDGSQTITGTKIFGASPGVGNVIVNSSINFFNGISINEGTLFLQGTQSGVNIAPMPIYWDDDEPNVNGFGTAFTDADPRLWMTGSGINWVNSGQNPNGATITQSNTAVRTYTFPDKDGTVAMLSDTGGGTAGTVTFTPYLTIGSTDVQNALQELKDELDVLSASGAVVDVAITNGSTNPVENNAIFDEFQLVGYLAAANTFTGANIFSGTTNTFTNTVIVEDTTNGLEIFNDATRNNIDTNAHALRIYSQSNSANNWEFGVGSSLIGTGTAYIDSPYITVDEVAYAASWNGSTRVPTRNAVYDKIESLSGTVNAGALSSLTASQFLRSDTADAVDGVLTFNAIPAFNGGTSGVSAPFTVDSTERVVNLNADLLDGVSAADFLRSDQSDSTTGDLTAASFITGSWTIDQDSTSLKFAYLGTNVFEITNTGAIRTAAAGSEFNATIT